jgi:hypothetical protein
MANIDNLLRRLRTTLDRPDTVLLVGSGTSLWSGLPTWENLLNQLAEFVEVLGRDATAVRQEIKNGDLLLAASYAVHQLHPREFGSFVRQATKYPQAKPATIHRLIATLGPSCFVTTNYDRLMETAIGEFGPHGKPVVVTNRQVTEIADILPSYARGFVFKYHGDVEDTASIVLTRDQYRRIQHEYPATTRAFGTLLATRPVVMIGFGLRDLDFLAVQDELVAAFEGQVGEYFAIMPDFDDVRAEYWRKTYRTEIISYETTVGPDGRRDHSNLLTLLEYLQPIRTTEVPAIQSAEPLSSTEFTLRLARLASSITRKAPPTLGEFLPLTVSIEPSANGYYLPHASDLSRLLQTFGKSFMLLGLPGSGKSFALAKYAAQLAADLLDHCIQEQPDLQKLHVPILVNLAVYAGDLRQLIQQTLPTGLDLSSILAKGRTTVILDGANEVPREFIENERWIGDFQELISSAPNCQFILGSRNETWLSTLSLTRFSISDIDTDYVAEHFSLIGRPEIEKNPELITTLSKPLFFVLAKSNRIDLNAVATPADVYSSFFGDLSGKWIHLGQHPIDFTRALELVAFEMLAAGAEFATKRQFEDALQPFFATTEELERVIAFLLAQGTLLALAGHRLAFFHQSVTEYLAARIIAQQFREERNSIRARLQDKRWDQALFLAMSFLDEDLRREFLHEIVTADLAAAARAAHYIEVGQAQVINKILERASKLPFQAGILDFTTEAALGYHLERLPYTQENIGPLKRLSKRKGVIGGAATGALFRIETAKRNAIINEILHGPDDWNYIQTFVQVSRRYWSEEHFDFLISKLVKKRKKADSLTIFGELISEMVPPETLLSWCNRYIYGATAAKYALLEALRSSDSRTARSILLDLVSAGEDEAIYPLWSNLEFHSETLERDELPADSRVARALVDKLKSKNGNWAISLARKLIDQNASWCALFKPSPKQDANLRLLLNVASNDEPSIPEFVTAAIENLAQFDSNTLSVLGSLDFWESANSSLVLAALSTREPFLASGVMEQAQGREFAMLSVRSLDWWLDWEEECARSKIDRVSWCGFRISQFLSHGDQETRTAILTRFNDFSEAGFEQVGRLVYQDGVNGVTTDQISKVALDRLLNRGSDFRFSANILGHAATEEFVSSVMIPHLQANPRHSWIRGAIEIAGNRHNRRYLVGDVEAEEE